jgi:sterol desaturase/sphingolipid hydroxylase (fatty acid hydroxylase superfamily)
MVIGLLVAVAAAFFALERFWPAGPLPSVKGWWARVAILNAAQVGIVVLAGLTWDKWFLGASLLNLSKHVGDIWAALLTYLVSCLIFYWWHRVRHESQLFWRLCHQLHHSPRRIELLTSFYKHPVEITINSVLTSAIVYPLMGCSVRAAAIYTVFIAIAEYFYHWNIRTYAKMRGPYNRRNVYGAALSFGPKLPEPMWRNVFNYGLGDANRLASEFGLPREATNFVVVIETRTAGRTNEWELSTR